VSAPSLGLPRAIGSAALAGFACMAAELTAVRVQAPHFGDSAYVWTNVIGVILAALAGGAWLGGRLSLRADAAVWLVRLLGAAGLLLAAAPLIAGPLGSWLLPANVPLDAAMPAIVRGSLVATAILFALPMLLLGAAAPMLVTRLSASGIAVGEAAGAVTAAGTLGSLAGTFAATHWLVPTFGCRVALAIAGACLFAAAFLVAPKQRTAGAIGMLLVVATALLHQGPLRPPLAGRQLLAERETRYQFLQVLREPTETGGNRTLLVINEGLDSYHSVAVDGSAFTDGAYYDWHALAPLLIEPGKLPANLRALSIGDAAGSLRTVYAGVHPGLPVDAVDIDPVCMELGDRYFLGEKATGSRFAMDGRVLLQLATQRWNVIHVDAYAHQVYVPAHLSSREFFTQAERHLLPNGILACNVGALQPDDPVLRAIGTTIASVFGHAIALHVPRSRNFLVIARKGDRPDVSQLAAATPATDRLTATDAAHWREILHTAADPARWSDVGSGGAELHDDRPELDELLNRSYVQRSDRGKVVECQGSMGLVGAEIAANEAARKQAWQDVLKAVATSREPSAYLRELAGDARWSLRELHAAGAEYQAALELKPDAEAGARLRQKAAQLELDRLPQLAAEDAASRNGWLAVGLGGLAAATFVLLRRIT
jgi:spermidine synthase